MTRYDVLLIGRNPVAAVLASRIAESDRSVALIDDGMEQSITGIVRWLTLRDLGLGDHSAPGDWPVVQEFTERLLLEEGSLDAIYRSERLTDLADRFLVTDSVKLTDAIVDGSESVDSGAALPVGFLWYRGRVTGIRFADGSEIEARLTIVTSGNRLVLGATDQSQPETIAPPIHEQIEISWTSASKGEVERERLAGGPLAEVGASASLMTLPERIVLSLVAPAEDLVREAVVVTDLLAGLLAHPALAGLPPLDSALSARVRLLALPPKVTLDRNGAGCAVLGAMEGMCDPGSFDREIRLASAIAGELATAPLERYGDVALFGAVAGAVSNSPWAERDKRLTSRQVNADWVLDDPDQLGPALARMARPSTFE